MLKVHTQDGLTHTIDLSDGEQARAWLGRLSREDFQATIQGVTLVARHLVRSKCMCGESLERDINVQYSVSRPDDLHRIFFHAEAVEPEGNIKGGERITLFADDVRLTLMAHTSQLAARVTFAKLGKQTFNALRR